MKCHVHIFAEVRVKVPSIEAGSQTEAIKKATEQVDLYRLFERDRPAPEIEYTEWNEHIHGYLVDQGEDKNHLKSSYYKSDGVTPENGFYAGPKAAPAIPVDEGNCELEGPYECAECHGHMQLDTTFLEQVNLTLTCPYCRIKIRLPEQAPR